MIFTMTDEIAFKLGKFDFPSFYNIATWRVNKEPFELAAFFTWTVPGGMGGWACKEVNGNYETDWENVTAGGTLKLNEIKDVSHKLAYIRGRLASYSVTITETSITVGYANSYAFRDFLADCFNAVIQDKFVLLPPEEGDLGRKFNLNAPKFTITKEEVLGTVPGTPGVTLTAPKEVIDYIIGK